MFNVPGWSVSSSSLQTQQAEKKSTAGAGPGSKDTEPSSTGTGVDSTARPSKKRKRGGKGKSTATSVTADNLVTLWEKHIERKAASRGNVPSTNGPSVDPTQADKKSAKKQKQGQIQVESGKAGSDININATATLQAAKHKFEKRKLSKKNRHEARAAGLLPPSRTPAAATTPTQSQTPSGLAPPPTQSGTKLTPLQVTMRQKLISARFRHLNQTLYTSPSTQSLSLFAENPQMFDEYHEGFRKQVEVWPENPVDGYIQAIRERGQKRFDSQKGRFRKEKTSGQKPPNRHEEAITGQYQDENPPPPLPRTNGLCTVADLGCGDATLAQALAPDAKKLHLRLLSYDLHAAHPLVTRADIAHVPLPDGSVDVAVFCLALMGTNWIDFVEEAYRLLRWRGELWVAEIKSRFGRVPGRTPAAAAGQKRVEHSVGKRMKKKPKSNAADDVDADGDGDVDADLLREIDGVRPAAERTQETDPSAFVEVLRKRGFALKEGLGAVDRSNKMFVKMEFVKALSPSRGKGVPVQSSHAAGDDRQGKWRPKTRFVETGEEGGEGDEGGVLKPCLYKLR